MNPIKKKLKTNRDQLKRNICPPRRSTVKQLQQLAKAKKLEKTEKKADSRIHVVECGTGPSSMFHCFSEAFEAKQYPGGLFGRKIVQQRIRRGGLDADFLGEHVAQYQENVLQSTSHGNAICLAYLAIHHDVDLTVLDMRSPECNSVTFSIGAKRKLFFFWDGDCYSLAQRVSDNAFFFQSSDEDARKAIWEHSHKMREELGEQKLKALSNNYGDPFYYHRQYLKARVEQLNQVVNAGPTKTVSIDDVRFAVKEALLWANYLKQGIGKDSALTPRTSYSQQYGKKVKGMVSLLMQLDSEAMNFIRTEFEMRNWRLDVYDFVLVVCANINSSQARGATVEEIDTLVEMFREIDVNGDGTLEWEEFTSYLVELAGHYYEDIGNEEGGVHYRVSAIEDFTSHDYACEDVRWLDGLKRMVLFEKSSRRFKVYDKNLRCHKVVRGHRAPLLSMAYIEESDLLVTTSEDKTICFWNTKGNKMDLTMQWTTKFSQVCVRWINHTLITADTRGVVTAWSLERAEPKYFMEGHTDIVMNFIACDTVDPPLLATCSLDLTVRTWDLARGEEQLVLRGHEKGVVSLAYCADVNLLVSGGLDNFVLVWNPVVKAPIFKLVSPTSNTHCVGIEVVPGTADMVVGDNRGVFRCYDLRTFRCIQTFSVPHRIKNPSVTAFTCTNTAELVVCATTLLRFERMTGTKNEFADDHPIQFAKFNPLKLSIITCAGNGIKVWDALTGRLDRIDRGISNSVITAACLDGRQRRIIFGNHEGEIKVYNYNNGAYMKKLDSHSREVTELLYCDSTKEIISSSWDKTVVCHVDKLNINNTCSRRVEDSKKDVTCTAKCSNLHLIATGSSDRMVRLYEFGLGPVLAAFAVPSQPSFVIFLSPYPVLLIACVGGELCLCHVMPAGFSHDSYYHIIQETNYTKSKPRGVHYICWDPNSQFLYAGDDYGCVKVWSLLDAFEQLGIKTKKYATREQLKEKVARAAKAAALAAAGASSSEAENSFDDDTELLEHEVDDKEVEEINKSESQGDGEIEKSKEKSADEALQQENGASIGTTSRPLSPLKVSNGKKAPLDPLKLPTETGSVHHSNFSAPKGPYNSYNPSKYNQDDPKVLANKVFGKPLSCFKCHKEGVVGLDLIMNTVDAPTVITWSFDCTVHLWNSRTGEKLGSLIQGHNKRHPKRSAPWGLQYNLGVHVRQETQFIECSLQPPLPPAPTSDDESPMLLTQEEVETKRPGKRGPRISSRPRTSHSTTRTKNSTGRRSLRHSRSVPQKTFLTASEDTSPTKEDNTARPQTVPTNAPSGRLPKLELDEEQKKT